MDLKKIGKFIAENRKKAGFSQESLAEELDISNRSVSKWERGICLPETTKMPELCKLFNHYFRNDALTINPVDGVNADKSLKRTRFEFSYLIPDYDVMVAELAEWVKDHKEMYPHYNL